MAESVIKQFSSLTIEDQKKVRSATCTYSKEQIEQFKLLYSTAKIENNEFLLNKLYFDPQLDFIHADENLVTMAITNKLWILLYNLVRTSKLTINTDELLQLGIKNGNYLFFEKILLHVKKINNVDTLIDCLENNISDIKTKTNFYLEIIQYCFPLTVAQVAKFGKYFNVSNYGQFVYYH